MKALSFLLVIAACTPLTPQELEERKQRIEIREYARVDARNEMWDRCGGQIVVMACSEDRGPYRCQAHDYRQAMARCLPRRGDR